MLASKYEKEKEPPTQVKEKRALGLDYSNLDIDLVPQYLTPLEREIMISALPLVANIPPKYFEKIIQCAYIFDAVENLILPLDQKEHTPKNQHLTYLSAFVTDFGEYLRAKESDLQKAKELASKIREKYFTADDKMSSEKKRLALVTQINKVLKNYIPYHIKINHTLVILEAKGLFQHNIIGKKTLWNVEPHFYQRWLERHRQLVEEKEQKIKEESAGDIRTREENAYGVMYEKYGYMILEFFAIEYWDIIGIKPVSLVMRYMKDVLILTTLRVSL